MASTMPAAFMESTTIGTVTAEWHEETGELMILHADRA
jgi:hypothetical protein